MQSVTRKSEATTAPLGRRPAAVARKPKLSVLLITGDEALWPQLGPLLSAQWLLKQVDSIEELLSVTPGDQAGILLWDARGVTAAAAALSRLQLHSARWAVVVLDEPGTAPEWTSAMAARQIVAHIAMPMLAHQLNPALDAAQEEVYARIALLGDSPDAERAAPAAGAAATAGDAGADDSVTGAAHAAGGAARAARRLPWKPVVIAAVVLLGGVLLMRRFGAAPPAPPAASTSSATAPSVVPSVATPLAKPPAGDEEVDLLIEKAQQAMLDRHYIEPAAGSALATYRSVLLLDPGNGEARQGLERLAEILYARVQSALDERKIDVALQSIETARSINPADSRLAALDERIAGLRAEFGPAQILAAISAENFDRAAQLIDDAARTKTLGPAKLSQLREELRRRHDEADAANFVKLVDTRLQQDKVIGPRNDNAAYYLTLARAAGAGAAALQPQSQEISRRLTAMLHAALDEHRFADAERLLADARNDGIAAGAIAALQHDLMAARSAQEAEAPAPAHYLDAGSVQEQIVAQARAALDAPPTATLEAQATAPPPAAEVGESELTRIRGFDVDYPADALRKGIEGWVELSFLVTAEGKVARVAVLDSSPKGVFDSAAAKALARARYKPPVDGGKPTAVSTRVRIAFRMTH